ncbi:respiratory chain complex I subunit 1 family protein [Celerinatantimonas yamalensis]|uniref:Respiratory chain complex I subunit 1 family protein n=1 Tax=Celerinatantimonas yamalensis TaxID=559956 RepID=A0ABW9GC16_9GAMM
MIHHVLLIPLLCGLLQALLLLAIAPFFAGLSRVLRAKMHNRQGPPISQEYRDIFKLLARQDVAPVNSGSAFRCAPFILLGTLLVVAMALPMMTIQSPFAGGGDIITLIYLLAIFRFFFALSGIDSGSPFAGIGASREMTLGVLVEPVLMLSLIVVALVAGSTNIGVISAALAGSWQSPSATLLALLACGFALFIEMGKVPFDVAEAEQELQEGPLSEYSGASLALMKWSLSFKQVVVAALFLAIFIPFGKAASPTLFALLWGALSLLLKLVVVFVLAALVENSMARGRFLLNNRVTWLGFGVAALALVFYLTGL